MECIFLQPLLAQLYLIIIPVENTLCGFAAEHREAFALFIFISKKFGLPGDIAILQHILLNIELLNVGALFIAVRVVGEKFFTCCINSFFKRGVEHRILWHSESPEKNMN